jgi:glycerate 2-kinase
MISIKTNSEMNNRQEACEIFLAGVESVMPENLIKRFISLKGNALKIDTLIFDLSKIKNIYLIGAGKASATMAQAMEDILGNFLTEGHVVTKYAHSVALKITGITEAGHPVPDENGIKGTEKILAIAAKANEGDLVICLISGGGSALIADLPKGCTLSDLKILNDVLLKSGASVQEINCIRKHLSRIKGGQLAKAIAPATTLSLILSDVIGDQPDVIASGPTAPDPTTFADAMGIIKKYRIETKIPVKIILHLQSGVDGKSPETMKDNDVVLCLTHNLVIGTNKLALIEAEKKAKSLGYTTQIITNTLQGDVSNVAGYLVKKALCAQKAKGTGKLCLLFGGEPTVKVTGSGLGGRNQHLAILVAKMLESIDGITVLSGGTDGTDGPTDAAGAVCDSNTLIKAKELNLSIEEYISNFDSYHFFEKAGGLLFTGPTRTNVMDLMIALVE